MGNRVRPLTTEDLDALRPLDRSYCERLGCEALVDPASLSFYARSGHAFVLEVDGEARGFLLGQAIWDGRRPAVSVRRVVAAGVSAGEALLQAVTKSAYDSGVYDLLVEQPEGDEDALQALVACDYRPRPVRIFARVLGSRSQQI